MLPRSRQSQSGFALLAALLVVVVCVGVSVTILLQQQLLMHQASVVMQHDRMVLSLEVVQGWAESMIENEIQTGRDVRSLKNMSVRMNNMHVGGKITPLGGRFNLNLLQKPEHAVRLNKLIHYIWPRLNEQYVADRVRWLTEWLMPRDHDDPYYAHQVPPYRMAHQRLSLFSEVQAVRGFDAAFYRGLLPYASVLPDDDGRVNINNVSSFVLASVTNISLAEARSIVHCRGHRFYKTVHDFVRQCAPSLQSKLFLLTADNAYYLLSAWVSDGEYRMTLKRIIKISIISDRVTSSIISQEYISEKYIPKKRKA